MRLYPRQRDFCQAMFEDRDAHGLRPYRRGVFSNVKKSGKTALGAASGLYMLCFDEFEACREVASIATDLDQARLIQDAAEQMVKRSHAFRPWLERGTLRILRDEIVLEDGDVTGVFRCLSTDTKGLHGISPSCLLVDETWTQPDYDLLEACSLPPTRRCPLELHFSYAGLKAQQQEGSPLWDLFRAGMAGSDPKLFFLYESGRQANFLVPWITEQYLQERERALPINRFRRLHYNEWGSGDSTFLTEREIARAFAAGVHRVNVDRVNPWVLSVDYGRTRDMTALCVARVRKDGIVQVGELVVMKGSRDNPVPLELVEQEILNLKSRFRIDFAVADQWQLHGSVERLRKHGLKIDPVTIGPSYLNNITTNFLALMRSGRFQCFPHQEFEAQLGSVVVKESFYGIRIDSGAGAGVRSHDDMVIAAAMAALLAIERSGGRAPALSMLCVDPRTGQQYWTTSDMSPEESLPPSQRPSLSMQQWRRERAEAAAKAQQEQRRIYLECRAIEVLEDLRVGRLICCSSAEYRDGLRAALVAHADSHEAAEADATCELIDSYGRDIVETIQRHAAGTSVSARTRQEIARLDEVFHYSATEPAA